MTRMFAKYKSTYVRTLSSVRAMYRGMRENVHHRSTKTISIDSHPVQPWDWELKETTDLDLWQQDSSGHVRHGRHKNTWPTCASGAPGPWTLDPPGHRSGGLLWDVTSNPCQVTPASAAKKKKTERTKLTCSRDGFIESILSFSWLGYSHLSRLDLEGHLDLVCYLMAPEALKDQYQSFWACFPSAPSIMMSTDSLQSLQPKGEAVDFEFTNDTDHRLVPFWFNFFAILLADLLTVVPSTPEFDQK